MFHDSISTHGAIAETKFHDNYMVPWNSFPLDFCSMTRYFYELLAPSISPWVDCTLNHPGNIRIYIFLSFEYVFRLNETNFLATVLFIQLAYFAMHSQLSLTRYFVSRNQVRKPYALRKKKSLKFTSYLPHILKHVKWRKFKLQMM